MQKLSKAAIGRSYTIQWMFGVPEVMDFLREHHVEEGDNIQIIRKLKDALIVGVKGSRFAMGNEIADRIQVSKIIKRTENKKWACYNMADLFCDGVARLS